MKQVLGVLIILNFAFTAMAKDSQTTMTIAKYDAEANEYYGPNGFLKSCGDQGDLAQISVYINPKAPPAGAPYAPAPFKIMKLTDRTCAELIAEIKRALDLKQKIKLTFNNDDELLPPQVIDDNAAKSTKSLRPSVKKTNQSR